ncbi:YqiA/YcfP family alpha/beta fold hydrolase [Acinetobacter sp. Marseille-Q1618]|uniref:YqiA/YcfP family alpha/beta fold hydrolase n=1 Tax=Acinetobacter sp. Marseille-Q1618 TaxID=2697502 RepID=UPI00156DC626|nr:YqiA/YcfP family alpha/beta fold hydrolase [Acinetobacter sp. Marseille-Q1618]
MNIIYLHGFQSSPLSIKGQQLYEYSQYLSQCQVHLPDLNYPPNQVTNFVSKMIEELDDVALVGSSLGGFYATQLAEKFNIPAVLINPAVQPWVLFRKLFGIEQLPYQVNEKWTLDNTQLNFLEQTAIKKLQHSENFLVLLQQGDEVLDYREAQAFYRPNAFVITEMQGNHAMEDFAEKIPMLIEFLSGFYQS